MAEGRGAPQERVEAFVVRTALGSDGEPLRSRVVHVRSQAETSSVGWAPAAMVAFMEDCLRIPRSAQGPTAPAAPVPTQSAQPHVVDLDAGTVIGGRARDIELGVATDGAASFTYTADLASRPYGAGSPSQQVWTPPARRTGSATAGEHLILRFAAVPLPDGLHRLRLRITVPPSGHPPPMLEVRARRR